MSEPVPVDVPFFDKVDWVRFLEVVHADLNSRGIGYERMGTTVMATTPKALTIGLTNLAQMCYRSPGEEWPRLVRNHFDNLFTGFSEPPLGFSEARDMLKVRLYPDDATVGTDDDFELVSRPFAESVIAVPAIDLPTAVHFVSEKDRSGWNVGAEELFEIGYENTRDEAASVHQFKPGQEAIIRVVVSDSFFVTTRVVWLDELFPDIPPAGALVGLPHRHMILVHPLLDLSAVKAVQHMISMIRRFHDEGPGSLSRHLYWWRNGELRWLPARVEDGRIQFFPPDDFVRALEVLPPSG